MALSKSQEIILNQLKMRGAQSVKILANRLRITTMGARQHLEDLQENGFVDQAREEKQTRGRPVHLWKLTARGHQQFPDSHKEVSVELIKLVRETMGEETLNQLINSRAETIYMRYYKAMKSSEHDLQSQLEVLLRLRNEDGFMAEIRLLPGDKWLLIENHCPTCAAAESCRQFCRSELEMLQQLLADNATVERVDHLLDGARRCAYRVVQVNGAQD
ncbi:MAG: transcriptional regulator [Gammaproteobacteria bacterium]|nr:transcriptional regulator [Gammaproteobacteria bacterium]